MSPEIQLLPSVDHAALFSLRSSGHLTGLKRKMPQFGIFPNCSLRSQLRLSLMLNEIDLEVLILENYLNSEE